MSVLPIQRNEFSSSDGTLVTEAQLPEGVAESVLGLAGYSNEVEIGRGGFGVVYRARQNSLNRSVAIKLMPAATMSEQTRKRFERECQAMAMLAEHPNIVSIYDHGVTDETCRPYIVMEYVSGGSLADRDAMAWEIAVEVGVKLCGSLETAHRAGIIHRDVKPENVLLTIFDQVKLADFGVAKVQDSSDTPTGHITASILHAAPEILLGRRPDPAADVYSLASTIYTLILGHAPFARDDEETLTPLITRICVAQPPDLRVLGVPDAVARHLERAMAKEPDSRFASAREFGHALRDAQRRLGLPVTDMQAPCNRAASASAGAVPGPRTGPAPMPSLESLIANRAGSSKRRWTTLLPLLTLGAVVIAGGASGTALVLAGNSSGRAHASASHPTMTSASGTQASTRSTTTTSHVPPTSRVPSTSHVRSTSHVPSTSTTSHPIHSGAVSKKATTSAISENPTPNNPAPTASPSRSHEGPLGPGPTHGTASPNTRIPTKPTPTRAPVPRTTSTTANTTAKVSLISFVGMSRDQANAWLTAHGLAPQAGNTPTRDDNPLVQPYTVVAQQYPAGTQLAHGTVVQLTSADNGWCAANPGTGACGSVYH